MESSSCLAVSSLLDVLVQVALDFSTLEAVISRFRKHYSKDTKGLVYGRYVWSLTVAI